MMRILSLIVRSAIQKAKPPGFAFFLCLPIQSQFIKEECQAGYFVMLI